jgi:hypothetical protein
MNETLTSSSPASNSEEDARERAIKQIERRRRFQLEAMTATLIMLCIAASWAISEYNNAGGWPTNGFSQSSGTHDVWNLWIIYPFFTWLVYLAARAWVVFRRKPISESEIRREIERQGG